MPAMTRGVGTVAAFALAMAAWLGALFTSIVVTAGLSSSMSAGEAGDALLWMGGGQLIAMVAFAIAFGGLARHWTQAAPRWWMYALFVVLALAAFACAFLLAMVMMNR